MYTNSTLKPIDDNALYVGLDGTQWANTDKSTIPELHKVTETPRPDEAIYITTGFHIDSKYKQVWEYEPRPVPPVPTLEELKAEYKIAAKNTYVSWFKINSDDYYICNVRTGTAVPQDIIDAGVAKDKAYSDYKLALYACTSYAEVKSLGYFE